MRDIDSVCIVLLNTVLVMSWSRRVSTMVSSRTTAVALGVPVDPSMNVA